MALPSQVRFSSPALYDSFCALRSGDGASRELYAWLDAAFRKLSQDAHAGVSIPKRLIPKAYVKRYPGLRNLWKYDLPSGWRLLYTITDEKVVVVSIILDWLDHTSYERRFKY